MDNPGEILLLCRLCLVKDQVNIPIFEEQGDIRQIFLKISSCLPIKVSRDDQLPKKICDGCSNKLDLLYEFWNTSANAEKTLLSWLGQAGVKDADETINAVAQQIAKPAETQVKEETETLEDGHVNSQNQDNFEPQSFDEGTKDEDEAPPPKRARRSAAVKAQINITPESDDDDDLDSAEPMTKMEGESDESDGEEKDPSYAEVPGTSADDQAGPSGVGKDGAEAPYEMENPLKLEIKEEEIHIQDIMVDYNADNKVTESTKSSVLSQSGLHLESHQTNYKKKYKCEFCDKRCAKRSHLKYHLISHSDERNFECDICEQKLKTLKSLIRHRNIHTREKLYICKVCNKDFLTSTGLNSHTVSHSNERNFECDICKEKFKTMKTLRMHRNIHTREKLYTGCKKEYLDPDGVRSHVVSHSNLHNFEYDICNEKIETVTQSEHQSNVHTLEELDTKELLTPASLKNDPISSHSNVRSFECDFCKEKFKTMQTLKTHRNIHTREKIYTCKLCSREFLTSASLGSHTASHSNLRNYECDICNEKFKTNSALKLHHNIHTREKVYTCKLCNKEFLTPAHLRRHSITHSDQRNFQCDICEKKFKTLGVLACHRYTHTKEMP